jgi:hypothetical protein
LEKIGGEIYSRISTVVLALETQSRKDTAYLNTLRKSAVAINDGLVGMRWEDILQPGWTLPLHVAFWPTVVKI